MPTKETNRVPTGLDGLDEVLNGGFIPHRTYLIRGEAGTGKTILGLHYLIEVYRFSQNVRIFPIPKTPLLTLHG